mmetsp:Transcript_43872/g.103757  ORF Transcript_43872/g.103757 Transcript_43872/m.103757 type:complete len:673 (-) Transcript_43872:60-2078(-)
MRERIGRTHAAKHFVGDIFFLIFLVTGAGADAEPQGPGETVEAVIDVNGHSVPLAQERPHGASRSSQRPSTQTALSLAEEDGQSSVGDVSANAAHDKLGARHRRDAAATYFGTSGALAALPWVRREVANWEQKVATSLHISATGEVIVAVVAFVLFAGVLYVYFAQPVTLSSSQGQRSAKAVTSRRSSDSSTSAARRTSVQSVSSTSSRRSAKQELAGAMTAVWPKMPSEEALVAVGPTYHVNIRNTMAECLARRGLRPARKGTTALVAMFGGPPVERQRGILEMCFRDTLSNKRTLAQHLAATGLTALSPQTFTSPSAMRAKLASVENQGMPTAEQDDCASTPGAGSSAPLQLRRSVVATEVRDGLWFLKYAGRDKTTHARCFLGAEAILRYWELLPSEEQTRYVAQAEVSRPLLVAKTDTLVRVERCSDVSDVSEAVSIAGSCASPANSSESVSSLDGHKVTIRAYVLLLEGGRCFLHRELLLHMHAQPYSMSDSSPSRHVLCHSKHEGVSVMRGSTWTSYEAVWPRLLDMMAATFGGFDHGLMKSKKLEIDTDYALPETWQSMFFGRDPVDAVQYTLLGVDLIVDQDLRPWLIEINTSPNLAAKPIDTVGSRIKAEVLEDFCTLVVDPLLHASAAASAHLTAEWAWTRLHRWSHHGARSTAGGLGFVEI